MNTLEKKFRNLELSTQVLIREAISRNIETEILDAEDNFIRLTKGTKTEYVKQATRTSADSYIVPLIMENKYVTKKILEENSVRVPHGKLYTTLKKALKDFEFFRNMEIVIKPNKTNFGIGVNILKKGFSFEEYHKGLENAFKNDSSVIAEEYIPGREYRFLVIGEKVPGILHRVPANVTGDGVHNIKELAVIKNSNPLRGKGYKTPLEKIRLGRVEKDFIKNQGKSILTVPDKNEQVFLRNNSNISTGGDSIDFTDKIREEYKEIALKATKAVRAIICGADIIIRDINEKPDENNYAVIELNFNPALHIHCYPYQGINRHPEKDVLNLLGF